MYSGIVSFTGLRVASPCAVTGRPFRTSINGKGAKPRYVKAQDAVKRSPVMVKTQGGLKHHELTK